MSISATYVMCEDGNYYKDPVWHGVEEGRWWFFFEADGPPELVVEAGDGDDALAGLVLKRLGVELRPSSRQPGASRCFPQNGWDVLGMRPAVGYFFGFKSAPPVPPPPASPVPPWELTGVAGSWDLDRDRDQELRS